MTIPIRGFQSITNANGIVPEDLGPGLNTSEEVVAAGGTANTLITNPAAGTKTLAAAAVTGTGFALVRKATVVDDISPVQTAWYIPLYAD